MFKVLYFTATWCGPCKAMAPVVAEAQQFLSIEKVDAEMNPDLTKQYGIRSVPTFVYIKDGQEVGRKNGAMRIADFQNLAQTYK